MRMRLCLYILLLALAPTLRAEAKPTQAELDAEEQVMLAAADAEAGYAQSRLGGAVGVEGLQALDGSRSRGLGASIALTYKSEAPFPSIGQIGLVGWPADLYLGPASSPHPPLELFANITLLPLSVGPVDFGAFVRLSTKHLLSDIAERAALGIAVQWSLDRVWALRYQAGCSIDLNFVHVQLVSGLALDVVFPYL
jgi:hypothetical protein